MIKIIIQIRLHPDKNPDIPNINEKFTHIRDIYDILKESESSDFYDRFGNIDPTVQ